MPEKVEEICVKRCIIIGAGDLTVSEVQTTEDDYVIAADGGYLYCKVLGIEPDLILGDFDSVGEKEAEEIQQKINENPDRVVVLPLEKDDTDMLAAIKRGLEEGCERFLIYGGQGGRLEHTLANIQCLLYLKEHGAQGFLMDGTGMVLVAKEETVRFRKEMEGFLSLFSLGEQAEVTIRQMKYTLDHQIVSNSFPIGISNEFVGEQGEIEVSKGAVVILLNWE